MFEQSTEREIFDFEKLVNKSRVRVCADPMLLHRRLKQAAKGQDLQQLVTHANEEGLDESLPAEERETIAYAAADQLLDIICKAFGVGRLDENGNGFTEALAIRAFNSLMDFFLPSVPTPGPSPSDSPPTEPVSSTDAA